MTAAIDEAISLPDTKTNNSEAATAGASSSSLRNTNDDGDTITTATTMKNGTAVWRKASFTEPEAFVLHSLLVDSNEDPPVSPDELDHERITTKRPKESRIRSTSSLSAEMLSSVPFPMQSIRDSSSSNKKQQQPPPPPNNLVRDPPKRMSILGLWSAFAAGIHPRTLIQQHDSRQEPDDAKSSSTIAQAGSQKDDNDVDSFPSDVEVVNEPDMNDDVSWDSQDDMNHHSYDAWEVLKDEYSNDYGFGFTTRNLSDNLSVDSAAIPSGFQILGTSADDTTARPHVLSPPLLDSLMNFLPDSIIGENYWLRFSLVRDGASLDTLKRYVRAAKNTILAIETPDGQVFGAYCSSPWRNHPSFYGSAPAFVWKMRYSRRTKSASLFEQAKLESEIDVYMAAPYGLDQPIQVCRHDILGVGGDDTIDDSAELNPRAGFAICIGEFLAKGTTSFSATFHNPSLCGPGDKPETFEIANLEVWSLTPCLDVDTAERLEMHHYFVEHGSTESLPSSPGRQRQKSSHSNSDLNQDAFFRRVGQNSDSESRRQRWQHMTMLNPELGADTKTLGSSPRFS